MDGSFVTTDCAHKTKRRISRQFDGAGLFMGSVGVGALNNAMTPTAPNSLVTDGVSNTPWGRSVATGISPDSGIVSFVHNGAASTDMTCYIWDQTYAHINNGKGWVLGGATSATSKQPLVDAGALCSFKVPPKTPYFIQAGVQSQPTELLVHDGGPDDPTNLNTASAPASASASIV